uniref:Uncharacterized protein n=1 Tax=Globodera rostochiensis TaxID=31243 RepID=A0A914H9S9_GLORO
MTEPPLSKHQQLKFFTTKNQLPRGTSREEVKAWSFEELADGQHELAQEAQEQEANDQIFLKFFATKK